MLKLRKMLKLIKKFYRKATLQNAAKGFLLSASAFVVVSCTPSSDPSITELVKARDYLKTEILVNGSGIANNTSVFNVIVQMRNLNNTVIHNFVPEYQIISGAALTAELPCTPSNQQGLSFCGFKANVPGFRRIRLTNIPNLTPAPEKDFQFDPKQVQVFAVTSGGGANAQSVSATETFIHQGLLGEPAESHNALSTLNHKVSSGIKGDYSNDSY